MSYYTDLDEDIGSIEQAEQDYIELARERYKKRAKILVNSNQEKREIRGAKIKVFCSCCGCEFMARIADRKRGWGKFCSKSCKAKKQNSEYKEDIKGFYK